MDRCFWPGLAVGMAAGMCIGARMHNERRDLKRMIHRTARKMEDAVDSLSKG